MYITYEDYAGIYGEAAITEADFKRLGFRAQRVLDDLTTGVDGVRKLAVAMPTEEYAKECVVRCLGELIHLSAQVEAARNAGAPVKQANGTVATSGAVTSVSSGAESMTFASGTAVSSAIREAAGSVEAERQLYTSTIRNYLGGIDDANGVRLLFGGRYPVALRG